MNLAKNENLYMGKKLMLKWVFKILNVSGLGLILLQKPYPIPTLLTTLLCLLMRGC